MKKLIIVVSSVVLYVSAPSAWAQMEQPAANEKQTTLSAVGSQTTQVADDSNLPQEKIKPNDINSKPRHKKSYILLIFGSIISVIMTLPIY